MLGLEAVTFFCPEDEVARPLHVDKDTIQDQPPHLCPVITADLCKPRILPSLADPAPDRAWGRHRWSDLHFELIPGEETLKISVQNVAPVSDNLRRPESPPCFADQALPVRSVIPAPPREKAPTWFVLIKGRIVGVHKSWTSVTPFLMPPLSVWEHYFTEEEAIDRFRLLASESALEVLRTSGRRISFIESRELDETGEHLL
ncbi:hypothetical protein C8J56DRAFT_1063772 [Mycena floridula]|nr:hypothetical protein C8J56DRAFT_1063772 [Mycena floridula]